MRVLSSGKLPLLLARVIPYVCLFAVGVALILCFALGRSDLAIKGLYIAIPVTLASGIAIWKANIFKESSPSASPSLTLTFPSFSHIVLLFVVLYLISLCLLISSESRPLSYFVLTGVMAALILVEILATGREHTGQRNIILLQITALLAISVFGQTLKLPLYHGGGGDIFSHMHTINTVVESGYVTSAMGGYQYFPLFHIFGASAAMLTGMELQTSYFIFNGLVFIISIPIVYLLTTQVTQDAHLPLVTTLLYSLSGEIIFGGMYMITRTMAFVLCLLVLYLLIRGGNNLKLKAIAVFLIVPLTFMHQTTLLYFSAILVALILIEFVIHRRSHYIGYTYPMLFTLAYLSYWVYIAWVFIGSAIKTIALTTEPVIIPGIGQELLFISLSKNLDLTIVAFLVVLGIVGQLYKSRKEVALSAAFAVFSFMAIVLYFPGPASFLYPIFLTYRLPLLLSPFIAFAMAAGILLLVQQAAINKRRLKSMTLMGISLLIIFLFSFSSMAILGNRTDFDFSKIRGVESSNYFTKAELGAFSFWDEHGGSVPIYTDYNSCRYIRAYLNKRAITSLEVFDSESVEEGYMLLRVGELESRGQLGFVTGITHGFMGEGYLYKVGDTPDLEAMWGQEHKIFDNGAVQIYSK